MVPLLWCLLIFSLLEVVHCINWYGLGFFPLLIWEYKVNNFLISGFFFFLFLLRQRQKKENKKIENFNNCHPFHRLWFSVYLFSFFPHGGQDWEKSQYVILYVPKLMYFFQQNQPILNIIKLRNACFISICHKKA